MDCTAGFVYLQTLQKDAWTGLFSGDMLWEGVDGPPVHDRCRCVIETLIAVAAGYATRNGFEGADYWLQKYGILPDKYIGKKEAKELG